MLSLAFSIVFVVILLTLAMSALLGIIKGFCNWLDRREQRAMDRPLVWVERIAETDAELAKRLGVKL